ncbi:FecCD family ABC transporter permease [Alkaliphilus oremlandii]|uniref:Transport system permease protein n=1 Tax=Alkaliphilus oremlandii (strain OhILAs) TaxID=350688 RepID=A8MKU4_ALKOO|nr:iron ABC transporter permease [Alkaliphilus oremlandii]ABW17761.1 transport system permease protein [Alkaliphilus oremlandii OhILAs]
MKRKKTYFLLLISPIFIVFFSLFVGNYSLSLTEVIRILVSKLSFAPYDPGNKALYIVWNIRMPRIILGMLVGASLAVSGVAFQSLFKNPLVSSSILGVTSGAGFGAALSILIFSSKNYTYLFAFGFGVLAVFLSYWIGKIYSSDSTVMLVLGGVIVSSVFSSLISLAKYMADPYNQLPTIVYWLMGSLSSASYKDMYLGGIPMIIGTTGLIASRWRLNVLSMGDREAQTLGINVNLNKAFVISCATLATAGAVSVSGNIGWVGLIIPHIGRMMFSNDNKYLIPISISLGASYLVLVDNLARTIGGAEIPLGILTSLLGGPFFVYLLKRTKGRGWA